MQSKNNQILLAYRMNKLNLFVNWILNVNYTYALQYVDQRNPQQPG